MSLTSRQVDRYLERLGQNRDASLARLHRAHLMRVPFESLDIHRGRPLSLDVDALFEKIVTRERGGFCYELNGLFAELLLALGFDCERLAARVYSRDLGKLGPPFDHLCLRVGRSEPWLCDVGFGRAFLTPLDLQERDWQSDKRAEYRVSPVDTSTLLLENRDAKLYEFSAEPHELDDFEPMCRYHQTSPESVFTRGPIYTIATEEGRITLGRGRYAIENAEGTTEREIDDDEFERILRDELGVHA